MGLPKLSIIVPSYNQAEYLEETILSVLSQEYPSLELIVIDGGSTDGSFDIIKNYQGHIDFWVSEKDRGQSHAINKGLEKATGEWVGWLNSDDCYLPGALLKLFGSFEHAQYDLVYGYCTVGSEMASAVAKTPLPNTRDSFFQLLHFFYNSAHIIPSNAAFVRRSLLAAPIQLRENLHYCMDVAWFLEIMEKTDRVLHLSHLPVGFFRVHPESKTKNAGFEIQREARKIAFEWLPKLPAPQARQLKRKLQYKTQLETYMKRKKGVAQLLILGIQYPELIIHDARYKILVKEFLFGH